MFKNKKWNKRIVIGLAAACMTLAGSIAGYAQETEVEDLFSNEINQVETRSLKKIEYVIDGVMFACPSDYGMTWFDEIGPTAYVADSFQLKTVIRQKNFEEMTSDKEALTEKAIAAGAEITKDVTETEVEGRKIVYYRMNLLGDDQMVMLSAGPDENLTLGGQIAILNSNLEEEEILKIYADIMNTAELTEKPNSTKDDIFEQLYALDPFGEKKEESKLEYKNGSVSFKVAEGFYSEFESSCDMYNEESFSRAGDYATVDIFVYHDISEYEDANGYMEYSSTTYEGRADVVLQNLEVNGYEFTGFAVQYETEEDTVYRVNAACDLPGGGMYLIQGVRFDGEGEFSLDTVKDFMEIQYE